MKGKHRFDRHWWCPGALPIGLLASLFQAGGAAADPLLGASEAQAFSPTAIIRTEINTVTGGLSYGGGAVDQGANTAAGSPLLNAITLNHDTRLTLDTSFTGQDLFRLRLRSGDFGRSGFFSNPPTPLTRLNVAFQEPLCAIGQTSCTGNLVSVNESIPLSTK